MVARRTRKGSKRTGKRVLEYPAKIRLVPQAGRIDVDIYRTDRDDPHSLAISFHIDDETTHANEMCIVVYSTLRESMRAILPKPRASQAGRGKRRSKPCRIPGK